jgi:hypothetical protein
VYTSGNRRKKTESICIVGGLVVRLVKDVSEHKAPNLAFVLSHFFKEPYTFVAATHVIIF